MEISRTNHLLFTVASIINPGHYVVLNRDREHQFKILCMEKALNDILDDRREFFDLNPLTYVAVDLPKKGKNLKRGLIQRKVDECMYEVFLMDDGEFVNVERSKIRKIDKETVPKINSLAFAVILYGIVPTKYCSEKQRRKVSQHWGQEAEVFVRKLFTTSNEVKVKKIHVKGGIIYGDILFKPNMNSSFVSLRKMLWKHEFCLYSAAYFKDLVLNATCEENTAEIKISEALNVPFHCVDNKMIMSSVIELPIGQEKRRSILDFQQVLETIVLVTKFETPGPYALETNLCDHETPESWSSASTSASINLNKSEKCGLGISTKKPLGRAQKIILMAKKSLKDNCAFRGILKGVIFIARISRYRKDLSDQQINPGRSILSPRSAKSVDIKSETKINNGSPDKVSNVPRDVFPQNKLQCVWSDVYGSPLVLFTDSVVKPVDSFIEMPISLSVLNNLQRKGEFSSVSPLQRWTIPSIRKNHNVVMIGSSKMGKTLSYIIAVADFVQQDDYFAGLPEGNGPLVVILCSRAQTGRFVYNMFHSLLGNIEKRDILNSKTKMALVHGEETEEQIRIKLTNECHVLISTPHCLERLLLTSVLTNFERLKCLILDEVDVLTKEPFKSPVYSVLKKADLSMRNCQKIFCGKKWTPQVKNLVNSQLKSYITVISSYFEVAIYAKLKPSIYVIDKRSKLDTVLEKIINQIGKFKILIVCERETEASRIYDCLRSKGISSLLAHENLMHYELEEVRSKWSCYPPYPLLIATDGALVELNIKDVQILIHFTIPCKSKIKFFARYSTFLKTVFESDQFQGLKETLGYTDIVLLEYDDVRQFPHVVEFVLRLGGTVAPKALEMYELICRRIELDKTNNPICGTLLSFGSCEKWENGENCYYRHAFETSRDSSKNLFTDGWVTFVVLKVSDVSSFSAKLLTHIQPSGKKVKISEQSLQISERLAKYYGFEQNRKPHGLPKIGDVCSIKYKVEETVSFYRAEIIEFTKVDKYNNPIAVNVRLLDQGDVIEAKNIDLYCLPDDLATFPPLTVEIKVVGLRPWDYEKVWGNVAVKFAKDLLTKKLEQNQYWSGRIALTLQNTLFLESVILKEFLPNVKCEIVEIVYQDKLLESRMAIKNTEHLPKLLKLCSKGNVGQPKKEGKIENELASKTVKPKWAFFEKDFTRVKFSSAENTNTIFLQLKKFEDLLIDVELACEEEAAYRIRKAETGLAEDKNSLELSPGMYCLALIKKRWNRGRVESIEDGNYLIYFVDHGDFASIQKSYVIPISENLLQQIPCQAIECSLVGIKEKNEFSEEVLDEIYNFSNNGQNDLYAYVIKKNSEPEVTGGQKYIINLLNLNGVSLNKFLVEKQIVEVLDLEKQYLEDIKIDVSEQEEEEPQVKYLEKEISELNVKESLEESFDITNLGRYLEEMSDDEDAHSFFEEFASRYLGISTICSEEPEIRNSEGMDQTSKNLTDSQNSQSIKIEAKTEKPHTKSSIKGAEKKETKCENLSQPSVSLKRCSETEEKLIIFNRKNILTPKILWFQADGEITLRIMLDNVENYSFDCTMTNILFRCLLREKIYVIDLKLYGIVNPSMTTITVQTFQVVIKLQKLSFPQWPKLHKDEIKYGWINADVENLQDPDEVEPSILTRPGNGGVKARKEKVLSRNLLHSFTDSENSELENTDIFNEDENESESDIENN